MSVETIAATKQSARAPSGIAALVLCYLIFFEFITISVKELAGLEFIGVLRDALLIVIAYVGILRYRSTSIHLYLIILASYALSLLNPDARPFANLVSAFVIGSTVRTASRPHRTLLMSLICICAVTVIYQSATIIDFDQFWFYNYLSNKEGDLFLATQYAYFRAGSVRPTGLMVSPSVMGLALIGLVHLYKTSFKPGKSPYIAYAIVLLCLLLIQTRALMVGYVFYVFIETNMRRMNAKTIALLYLCAVILVFFTILYFGDDSAYVRALLLYSVFEYLSSGILFPYFQADQSIVVDSQLIGFFYLTGIAGILFLAGLYGKALKKTRVPAQLVSFNFFSFCLFISIFQWSYDSFGLLIGFYALGGIFNRQHIFVQKQEAPVKVRLQTT